MNSDGFFLVNNSINIPFFYEICLCTLSLKFYFLDNILISTTFVKKNISGLKYYENIPAQSQIPLGLYEMCDRTAQEKSLNIGQGEH